MLRALYMKEEEEQYRGFKYPAYSQLDRFNVSRPLLMLLCIH